MLKDKTTGLLFLIVNHRPPEGVPALSIQRDPNPVDFILNLEVTRIIRECHAEPRAPASVQEADLDPQIRFPLPPSLCLEHRPGALSKLDHSWRHPPTGGANYTTTGNAEPMEDLLAQSVRLGTRVRGTGTSPAGSK